MEMLFAHFAKFSLIQIQVSGNFVRIFDNGGEEMRNADRIENASDSSSDHAILIP